MANLPDLSSLTESQLKELRTRADFLLGSRRASVSDLDLVHDVLLANLGPDCPKSVGVAKTKRPWSKFRDSVPALMEFTKAFKPRNRTETRAVLNLCVEELVDWLQSDGKTSTWNQVVNNLDKIPAVIDNQFPGYRKRGELPFILSIARV